MKTGNPKDIDIVSKRAISSNLKEKGFFSPTFILSIVGLCIICLLSIFLPEMAKHVFENSRRWSVINLDWLFVSLANLFLLVTIVLALSPLGKKRLGNQAKEYSNLAWFSMIITTGFGLTLVFWGVAEPAAFYSDWWGAPLGQTPKTPEAAPLALAASLYHWGLHPWAMYAMMALAVAYATYNLGLPLKLSSAFQPLLAGRFAKPIGSIIDSLAVIATLCGVATTMGLGARQASNALSHLYDIPNTLLSQSAVIILASILLVIILQKGINKGIKRFSLINLVLLLVFAFILFLVADMSGALSLMLSTPQVYAENFVAMSLWDDRSDTKFFHGWTVFYWVWWFSWAPFIGIFIAKISQGRSIRECVFAVVVVPTIFTFIWFSILGGVGLDQLLNNVGSILTPRLSPSTALFQMLAILPLSQWLSLLGILLVLFCFVSTSDTSLYVINKLTSDNPDSTNKLVTQFWVLVQGVVALSLLAFGGKKALESVQSASLMIGVIMCVLLLVASVIFIYNLKRK
ncbi:choline/carnitine/betaine transport family protein [Marinomonas sp. MED121]|uniref:BCCT family transporter n=1 Tax=Marinomonas sp. MED121 TaxID=314277 RepID=UPI0000690011|nr:BCCT family transporter [Marinomonas sp. MED121]EAQ67029.1 choline/carnitine/betaine transport family protein [Marinomonas sp. MED121]